MNRFCAQVIIGHPLTAHWSGGQTRGFLALSGSIQSISFLIDNPADDGEHRVVNQFDEQYSIMEIVKKLQKNRNEKGLNVEVRSKENSRLESEKHYYNVNHEKLRRLGFKRTREIDEEIRIMTSIFYPTKRELMRKKEVIVKNIKWQNSK